MINPWAAAGLVGRRPVLCGAAALCVTAVGGCAGYGKGRAAPPPAAPAGNAAPAPAAPAAAGTSTAGTGTASASAPTGAAIATVGDIPIGGGTILADRQLVVTRPSANEVRVLSAVCTHQGCAVDTVESGTISCPCHGSAFSLTGDVTSGPATKPLPAQRFAVVDGVVRI
jgi:Rieske Fe-S protein